MRNMFAGHGNIVIAGDTAEDDEEPEPLSVVCYRLEG